MILLRKCNQITDSEFVAAFVYCIVLQNLKEQVQLLTDARDQIMGKLKSLKQKQEVDTQHHLQELTDSNNKLLADLKQAEAEQQVNCRKIYNVM